jgi:hypothetical protein
MPRLVFPYYADDISAVARSLNNQIAGCGHLPGHVELLNMLARAVGARNFQHFRAQMVAQKRLMPVPEMDMTVDHVALQRLTRYFDVDRTLRRWPTKFSHQEPCLWVLWSRIPPRKILTEPQINDLLFANHHFEDPALLRRELKERGMVTRTLDGREYRRVERKPPPLAAALIRMLREKAAR